MAEIDKNLSWETSALGTFHLMNFAKKKKLKELSMHHLDQYMELKKKKRLLKTYP